MCARGEKRGGHNHKARPPPPAPAPRPPLPHPPSPSGWLETSHRASSSPSCPNAEMKSYVWPPSSACAGCPARAHVGRYVTGWGGAAVGKWGEGTGQWWGCDPRNTLRPNVWIPLKKEARAAGGGGRAPGLQQERANPPCPHHFTRSGRVDRTYPGTIPTCSCHVGGEAASPTTYAFVPYLSLGHAVCTSCALTLYKCNCIAQVWKNGLPGWGQSRRRWR
jgi:hypothetical protein